MNQLSTQIFEAVQGDVSTIQALAGAIASNNPEHIRTILAGKGLQLSQEESSAILDFAVGGGELTNNICAIGTIFT